MPTYSAQTLINTALTNLALLEQGGTPSVSDSNDGLGKLNLLLGQWRIQKLFVPSITSAPYALTAAQASYQIGPGGADFSTAPRPNFIEDALVTLAGPNPANPLQHRVRVTSVAAEYAAIPDKAAAAAIPDLVYNDRGNPFSTLYLWPVPRCATTTQLILYTWTQISDFATLASSQDLPDGYGEAISNALAVRLAPSFGSAVPTEVLQVCSGLAKQAEQTIMALNAEARGIPMPAAPQQQGRQ